MQSKWAGVLPQPHLDLAGGIALWRPAGPSSGSAYSSWKLFTPCTATASRFLKRWNKHIYHEIGESSFWYGYDNRHTGTVYLAGTAQTPLRRGS